MKRDSFIYELPDARIAKSPVSPRDSSKLLQYKNGEIKDYVFKELPDLLPQDTMLVMNNAKVIPARIFCKKESGAAIEVFLLEPIGDYLAAFSQTTSCEWKALIGNKKRWKDGVLNDINGFCEVSWVSREENKVMLSWRSGKTFAQLLEDIGKIPIPPYLNRPSEAADQVNYQTLYAKIQGSVAAPTAGLHFTPEVFSNLKLKNVSIFEATLHVGAGTFKPVDADNITEHEMHAEKFQIDMALVQGLLSHRGPKIAVGTTSLRVLESLYFIGLNLKKDRSNPLEVYQSQLAEDGFSYWDSLKLLESYLIENGPQTASTSIFIYPGKKVKSVDGIITNFHQPSSTLVMLIAALIGEEWKRVYQHALANDYRFLSYGDSSLLWFE